METPDINQNQIDGILQVDPSGELCQKLLTIFESEIPQLIQSLKQSINKNDNETSAQIVHAIRSSCLNIGAQKLADICFVMEKGFAENKPQTQDVTLVLQTGFEYIIEKLKSYLRSILKS